ncbi:hypothetical protein O181_014552 [Austropuccinia psidii MF-1]|uniref:Integrase zinc-binding domain-containing protein n=1 Tax=Austropuccinia psidii MF-1 TaxID=1389203 RepID=A0A9Q3GPY3_9BASI|nr:hypothetical protein [Austropuccinia psidii MF-1]
MVLCNRILISIIVLECHDNIYSGDLSEERKMKRLKTCAWWLSWRKYVIEYCHSCDRCQKANEATGKIFDLITHIQDPSTPLEGTHMGWVTALPPGGDKSYNAFGFSLDRYRKTPLFLKCHKDEKAMDTALLIRKISISQSGLFKNIIGDRDSKFTSSLWTNLSFWVQNYHSQQDIIHKQMD